MRRGAALWPVAVGIGWRQPHYRDVMARGAPDLDFLEVPTEDFLAPGVARRQLLLDAARRFPISLHGAGLGLGSAAGIDVRHLQRVRALVEAVKPAAVSEHAGFARARHRLATVHAHEQLPVPFSARGLSLLASQVDTVQQCLGRQILIENLGAYLGWEEDAIREVDFFNALAEGTGCGLLLDLDSLFVNALNRGLDDEGALRESLAWLDGVDPSAVGQYHLSGHSRAEGMVVADHGGAVDEPVWTLYRHALARIGARPTLIERDHALPPLAGLCEEVARARTEQSAFEREHIAPPPPRPSSRLEAVRAAAELGLHTGRRRPTSHAPAGLATGKAAEKTTRNTEATVGSSVAAPALADLQSGLIAALLAPPGADAALQPPAGVRAPAGIVGGLPRALRAYQAHASAQAERALATAYPRLRDRVEAHLPGSFASLAWACWRRHPPVDGDLGEWGEALIGLLAGEQAQGLPPLWTALARIEWELHRVARIEEPQQDLNSLASLGRLPAGAVRLVLADHVALHGGDSAGDQALLDLAGESFGDGPRASLMVWRDGWGGRSIALDGLTTRWLESLRAGLDLERALLTAGPAFDFSAWLSAAVSRGWLARVETVEAVEAVQTVERAVTPWGGR